MRLGESWAFSRGEDGRTGGLFEAPGVVGVVGEPGTDGQSSDRLSSHGSWLIFRVVCYDAAEARVTGSRTEGTLKA